MCVPAPNTGICGDGTELNTDTNTCVPTSNTGMCGTGTVLNTDTNTCVPAPNTGICGDGTELNSEGTMCVPINNGITCGDGTELNSEGTMCVPINNGITCGDGTELDTETNMCVPAGSSATPLDLEGRFVGKHRDDSFSTKGTYKIGDEKLRRISGLGTFAINGDGKCNDLSATNTLDFGNDNTVTMNVNGEICSKRFLNSFTGTYEIVSGTGDYDDASGSGDVSLLLGKSRFGGKISGDILIP